MADNSDQEKTLPASPKRLEDAREEGKVARSREVATSLAMLAGAGGLAFGGSALAEGFHRLMAGALVFDRGAVFGDAQLTERLFELGLEALVLAAPLMLLLTGASALGAVAIGGWIWSGKAVSFDISRLDPLRGLGNLASLNSLAELAKSIGKAVLVGVMAVIIARSALPDLIAVAHSAPEAGAARVGELVIWAFAVLAAAFVIIAAVDIPLVLWRHAKGLRMSTDELRRETKEQEGEPQVKARIRSLQRAMARRRMMAEVPKADVVVTNPAHYAVALSYAAGMQAPRVLAKGSDLVAARIRELAAAHGIPVLEAPPLARALFRHAEVGAEVPGALYDAVAQVLAWVFQVRRWRPGTGPEPRRPESIAVPVELAVPGAAA